MKTVVVTFGPPIPTPQGVASLNATYERVKDYSIKDGLLTIELDAGGTIIWNWTGVQNVAIDPHGSVIKPTISLK